MRSVGRGVGKGNGPLEGDARFCKAADAAHIRLHLDRLIKENEPGGTHALREHSIRE